MSPKGVSQYELAVEALLKEDAVRQRWDPKEFWGIVASLVVYLSTEDEPEEAVERQLHRLRKAKPSLMVAPAANIRWKARPLNLLDRIVIGEWDDPEFLEAIVRLPATQQHRDAIQQYMQSRQHQRPMVGFATTLTGQRNLAVTQASQHLEALCDLTLLFVVHKNKYRLYSLRGSWNRPGVRGSMLDRPTIERVLASANASDELAYRPFMLDELGESSAVYWHSADSLPLDELLDIVSIRNAVTRILFSDNGVAPRVRVAARWFSEAFWATEKDDAALALGVALDALIGSKSGLPGRAMRERFALLEPNAGNRAARATRYDEVFAVRSAVAHGGRSSRLRESEFVRGVQDEVTWAAWRLLRAEEQFGYLGDKELDVLFDEIRWGTRSWPTDSHGPTSH